MLGEKIIYFIVLIYIVFFVKNIIQVRRHKSKILDTLSRATDLVSFLTPYIPGGEWTETGYLHIQLKCQIPQNILAEFNQKYDLWIEDVADYSITIYSRLSLDARINTLLKYLNKGSNLLKKYNIVWALSETLKMPSSLFSILFPIEHLSSNLLKNFLNFVINGFALWEIYLKVIYPLIQKVGR